MQKNNFIINFLLFWVLVAPLVHVFPLYGQRLEDEVKELNAIYEKVQREYWGLKQNSLRTREQIKERIDNLDSILKTQYEKRNALTEELFLVTENLNKAKEQLTESQNVDNAFKNLLFETVTGESENVTSFYPKLIEPATSDLNRIKSMLEVDPITAVDLIIDYDRNLILSGETTEVYRTRTLNPENDAVEEVSVLRLGFIHSSFLGENFSSFLLREGGLSGTSYKWMENLPAEKKSVVELSVAEAFNQAGNEGLLNVPIDAIQAGSRLRSLVENVNNSFWEAIIQFFISGGIVMYPLLVVAIIALFVCYDRFSYFWKFRSSKLNFLEEVKSLINQDKKKEAIKLLERQKIPLINNIFIPFLEKRLESRNQADQYLQDQYGIYFSEVDKGLTGLAVLAAVAPLLGLLGTVTGMIELFDVITLYGTGNPKILASGISVALITTQTGLTIAVPIILVHHYFIRWKNQLNDFLDSFAIEVVQICYPLGVSGNGETPKKENIIDKKQKIRKDIPLNESNREENDYIPN